MNAQEKELLRMAVLRVLDANRTRWGLNIASMALHLRIYGFTVANFAGEEKAFHDAIADSLQYLCDKGVTEEVLKGADAGNRAWRITDKGVSHVDERG